MPATAIGSCHVLYLPWAAGHKYDQGAKESIATVANILVDKTFPNVNVKTDQMLSMV